MTQQTPEITLIPAPVSLSLGSGTFQLEPETCIYVPSGNPDAIAVGRYLADTLLADTGSRF